MPNGGVTCGQIGGRVETLEPSPAGAGPYRRAGLVPAGPGHNHNAAHVSRRPRRPRLQPAFTAGRSHSRPRQQPAGGTRLAALCGPCAHLLPSLDSMGRPESSCTGPKEAGPAGLGCIVKLLAVPDSVKLPRFVYSLAVYSCSRFPAHRASREVGLAHGILGRAGPPAGIEPGPAGGNGPGRARDRAGAAGPGACETTPGSSMSRRPMPPRSMSRACALPPPAGTQESAPPPHTHTRLLQGTLAPCLRSHQCSGPAQRALGCAK
jgi:hypothetical protein